MIVKKKNKNELQKEMECLEIKRKGLSVELDKLEHNIRILTREIMSLDYEWVLNKWFDLAHVYNEWDMGGKFRFALFKPLEIDSVDEDTICFRGVAVNAYIDEYGKETHELEDSDRHLVVSKNNLKKEFNKEVDKDSSLYKEMVEIINKNFN